MRIRKYRPFALRRKEEHEAWMADMARQGWRYKGGNVFGFQYFEQGAPADMVFTWDQAPRGKANAQAYRQQCREAGWELTETRGSWLCWSKMAVPGEPVQPLRGKADAIALYLDIQRQHSAQFLLTATVFFLNFRNLFGIARPLWFTTAITLAMAAATAFHLRGAFHAKARVRQLTAAGPAK